MPSCGETGGKAFLADISAAGALRVAGADALRFMGVMFAGGMEPLAQMGGLAQGAFLNAAGEVIDIAYVMRTGTDEFLVTCCNGNRDELCEWLQAHAALADDAGPVFGQLEVTDESAHLGMLMMAGAGALKPHEELLAACEGRIVVLDHSLRAGSYGVFEAPAWLVVVPVNAAAAIGDFLHAYPQFYVLGDEERVEMCEEAGTWVPGLAGAEYLSAADPVFAPWLREGDDFVGARALGR